MIRLVTIIFLLGCILTVTDANNCSTDGSLNLAGANVLTCMIEETMTPSAGGNDGVATVIPSGGTVSSVDPRTDLLASPDRLGYGAAATGGSNYVYVNNFNQLKTALETPGNYVLLDPSLSNTGIGFPNIINMASNTTLDGSMAPGSYFFPHYNRGFPTGNHYMINHVVTTNNIIYAVEFRGRRRPDFNSSHPHAFTGAINLRGSTVWYDHVSITEFWGTGIYIHFEGNNISFSNLKIKEVNKGLRLVFPYDTPRFVSLFNSEINASQYAPFNQGASHFHMWNNYIHGAEYDAATAGLHNIWHNGLVRNFSENNVFSDNQPFAEHGIQNVNRQGFIYANGSLYLNGDTTNGNIVSGTTPWTIPYAYTKQPANQVIAYVTANAGSNAVMPNGDQLNYTYQWNDPAQQTTAVATGLTAGTYQVSVTDTAGFTTVCSISLGDFCAPNFANGNALVSTQSHAIYKTNGVIESTQTILSSSIVEYNAGSDILLNAGFETENLSSFYAFIEGCD